MQHECLKTLFQFLIANDRVFAERRADSVDFFRIDCTFHIPEVERSQLYCETFPPVSFLSLVSSRSSFPLVARRTEYPTSPENSKQKSTVIMSPILLTPAWLSCVIQSDLVAGGWLVLVHVVHFPSTRMRVWATPDQIHPLFCRICSDLARTLPDKVQCFFMSRLAGGGCGSRHTQVVP